MTTVNWTPKDTVTALLVVTIWGINFVPMKWALSALSPLELGVGRYFFAALPLCFLVRFPAVRFRWVFAAALLQCVGQFSLLFWSLEADMTAALASILLQTQIYFTVLWSFVIFRYRPTKLLWVSMATAAVGLLFFGISAVASVGESSVTLKGIFLVLAGASMWGAANIVSRQVQHESPDYNPLAYIVWSGVLATLMYLGLLAVLSPDAGRWLQWETWQAISTRTWCSLLYLGWVSTLAGYGLWTLLLKRHHANRVAPFSLGVPVIGLMAGMLWLNEPVDGWQWIGSVFVGLSLVLVVFGSRWLPAWNKA